MQNLRDEKERCLNNDTKVARNMLGSTGAERNGSGKMNREKSCLKL